MLGMRGYCTTGEKETVAVLLRVLALRPRPLVLMLTLRDDRLHLVFQTQLQLFQRRFLD